MSQRWAKANRTQRKESPATVEGKWKVSTFFFLLISIQSVFLPWMPQILRLANMGYKGMAVVMSLVTVASVLSIKLSLTLVTISRSGAFRRLVMFFLLVSSLSMYIGSVALLDDEGKYITCTQKIDIGSYIHNNNFMNSLHNGSSSTATTRRPDILSNSSNITTPFPTTEKTTTTKSTTTEKSNGDYIETPLSVPAINLTNLTSTASTSSSLNSSNQSIHLNHTESSDRSTTAASDVVTSPSFLKDNTISNVTQPKLYPSFSISYVNSTPSSQLPFRNPPSLSSRGSEEVKRKDKGSEKVSSISDRQNNALSSFKPNFRSNSLPSVNRNEVRYRDEFVSSKISQGISNSDISPWQPYARNFHGKNSRGFLHEKGSDLSFDIYRKRRDLIDRSSEFHSVKKALGDISDKVKHGPPTMPDDNTSSDGAKEADKDPETEHDSEEADSDFTWLWVSLLLVFASLLGSGIESSVTRLWHCYSHGYHLFHNSPRYDMGGDDLLERTLTDTFELSATGEHYGWTRIFAGISVLVSAILLAFGCQIGLPPGWSLIGQIGWVSIGGILAVFTLLLVLPVPWGSIRSPKTPRPLSLYLDDEVLWEGMRRIASPTGTAVHGIISALPKVYVVVLLGELAHSSNIHSDPIIVLGVAASIIGEGFVICSRRPIATYLDSPGLVSLALGLLSLQMLTTWWLGSGPALWFVALSWAVVGMSQALALISVRQNALMLATISDQEREAWASWCCGQLGHGMGALLWPIIADSRWGPDSLANLLIPLGACSGVLSFIVFIFAILTRSRRSARRRVYHTLDLHSADDDDSSDENEDWLVKGARKEGLSLD